ncbi:hypothetical protein B0T17DRAFT_13065 [Bombardia bombarda]|uniref:Secreted protein n=1 Tax=Bombardia bombarda TaxID=252184 RepID=A0AA39XJ77_9PEZI|nr:hypothetical protein B0T17DRAFT_13065 [Bombardia bombarda]
MIWTFFRASSWWVFNGTLGMTWMDMHANATCRFVARYSRLMKVEIPISVTETFIGTGSSILGTAHAVLFGRRYVYPCRLGRLTACDLYILPDTSDASFS